MAHAIIAGLRFLGYIPRVDDATRHTAEILSGFPSPHPPPDP
jgi:hypothetical protein